MATSIWGLLMESLTSSKTIRQAIADMIADHEADPTAHLSETGSLQSHKASEIIDHLAESIVSDKIAVQTVNIEQLNTKDYFLEFLPWTSLDGFTSHLTGAMSYVASHYPILYLGADVHLNDKAFVYSTNYFNNLFKAGKIGILDFFIDWLQTTENTTVYVLACGVSSFPLVETSSHAGFKIINCRLWCTSSDGITQKLTDTGFNLNPPAFTAHCRLRTEVKAGSGGYVKFYVDGYLVATHTTSIPTVTGNYIIAGIVHTLAGSFSVMAQIGRVLVQHEY